MFWGTVIKEGQPLKSQKVLETSEFAVLHLSSAIVGSAQSKSTKLFAKLGKESEVIIANLSDKNGQQNLDHYINCTQNVTLFVKGPSEVHFSGYFEPKGDDMDDDMFYGYEEGAEEAGDSDEDSQEEKPAKSKAVEASLKQAKLNSARNAMAKPAGEESDESDLVDDMNDDEEDMEDMDDLDLDAEEEESEDEEIPVHKKKESHKAPVVQDSDDDSDDDNQLVDDDSDSDEEANLSALIDKAQADRANKMQKGNDGKPVQKPASPTQNQQKPHQQQ